GVHACAIPIPIRSAPAEIADQPHEEGNDAVGDEAPGQEMLDPNPALSRPRRAGGPHLLAGDPVEPGAVSHDLDLLADQPVRSPFGVELPCAAAVGPKDQAVAALFEAPTQMQVAPQRHAGPLQ